MDGRGDKGGPVAIIGMACRYPGARDPAEFHDLAVAGRRMFQPVAGLPGRPLHAALLDDWTIPPVSFGDPQLSPHDLGPVQKLAAEMTALALTDAGLRNVAGTTRTGLIIASVTPSVSDLVREEFGFAAGAPYPPAAYLSSRTRSPPLPAPCRPPGSGAPAQCPQPRPRRSPPCSPPGRSPT